MVDHCIVLKFPFVLAHNPNLHVQNLGFREYLKGCLLAALECLAVRQIPCHNHVNQPWRQGSFFLVNNHYILSTKQSPSVVDNVVIRRKRSGCHVTCMSSSAMVVHRDLIRSREAGSYSSRTSTNSVQYDV